MISGLRGLAQAFVRGAVAIGRGVESTYTALTTLGLDYAKERFEIDFESFDRQPFLVDEIKKRPSDQLISGALHQEVDIGIKANFKYDVESEWIDPTGKKKTITRSVVSDYRMSQDEIGEEAEAWGSDTGDPDERQLTGWELSGSWYRQREPL